MQTHVPMQVRQWVASCEAALAEQREVVEARQLEVEAAAARLRAAEAELDFLADARQVWLRLPLGYIARACISTVCD